MPQLAPGDRAYRTALQGWVPGLFLPPVLALTVARVVFGDVEVGNPFWGYHFVAVGALAASVLAIAPVSCAVALRRRGAPKAGITGLLSVPLALVGLAVWPLLIVAPVVVRRFLRAGSTRSTTPLPSG